MANNSGNSISTMGKVRETLAAALVRASEGTLSATDGKNMIGLANQITSSVAVEIKHQNMQAQLGQSVDVLGTLSIGDGSEKNK